VARRRLPRSSHIDSAPPDIGLRLALLICSVVVKRWKAPNITPRSERNTSWRPSKRLGSGISNSHLRLSQARASSLSLAQKSRKNNKPLHRPQRLSRQVHNTTPVTSVLLFLLQTLPVKCGSSRDCTTNTTNHHNVVLIPPIEQLQHQQHLQERPDRSDYAHRAAIYHLTQRIRTPPRISHLESSGTSAEEDADSTAI
jgi:hypothetical protein